MMILQLIYEKKACVLDTAGLEERQYLVFVKCTKLSFDRGRM
jgi:hypothetical protein